MNFPMPFKLDDEFRIRNRKHTKQERFNLERIIEEEGCADGALTVALIGTEKILCDGYTSLAICQEKGITPTEARYLPFKDRAAVLEWIDRRQRSRRNLTAEEMEARRVERTPRVVAAHVEGQSTRAIADKEGVSQSTIQRDLEAATESGDSVEPPSGKITGKDGKQRLATQPPKPPIRCDRHSRIYRAQPFREFPDCPQCQNMPQPKAKGRKPNAKAPIAPRVPSGETDSSEPKTKACPTCKGAGRIAITAKVAFTPPTLDEVRSYCEARKNNIDPEAFIAHYETNGWVQGNRNKPIKSWQACIVTWEKRGGHTNGNGKPAPNVERERAIVMGWYKPSSGEPFDPQKHCEKPT